MTTWLSPHTGRLLGAHQWQGQTNDCAPYAIAILLRGLLNLPVTGDQMAEAMNRPRWIGPIPLVRRIPNWATFPWGVVDVLRQHGVPAAWRWWATEDLLRQTLHRGGIPMPIFGQWRPLWAHIALLVGYDPQRGWGVVDAGHPRAEVLWTPAEQFRRWWRALGRLAVLVYPRLAGP